MKHNATIFILTALTAVTAASCTRKETPVAQLQADPAPEPVTIRESSFKPAAVASKPTATPMRIPQEPVPETPKPVVSRRPAAPVRVTLAQGTVLAVRVGETLTSEKNQSGDSWTGVLSQPVVVDGLVIAERGAEVTGRVTNVKRSGKVKGVGTIGVTLIRLVTADGQRIAVNTTSYAVSAKDETKRDVGKVAIVSGIGAAIGAIAGGGRGAAIGAGAGAGAGSGVVLATRGKPAIISNETLIRFRVASPVTITEALK